MACAKHNIEVQRRWLEGHRIKQLTNHFCRAMDRRTCMSLPITFPPWM